MNPKTKQLTVMAMLVAISVVLVYLVRFPIFPAAAFLEYDPADIAILIGTFAYGPLAGVFLTVIASILQGVTVSAHSGLYGILMHIIATSVLVIVSGVIYRKKHSKSGAVIGLFFGVVAMGISMMIANHFITPLFMTVPTEVVDAMLLPVILPFNLIKGGVNAVITFLLYKTVSIHIIHSDPKKLTDPNVIDVTCEAVKDEPDCLEDIKTGAIEGATIETKHRVEANNNNATAKS